MKRIRHGFQKPHALDPDFADSLSQSESFSPSSHRQAERKTQQFCGQVRRALNLALSDGVSSNNLGDLYVEDVVPAPDCGHLLVYISIPENRSLAEVLRDLAGQTPRLRSEVAMTIARKRAPELAFAPAYPDGGDDE